MNLATAMIVGLSQWYVSDLVIMENIMAEESSKSLPQPLKVLEGMELASIVFVRDYCQLHFEEPVQDFSDPILTIFTPPNLILGGNRYGWETSDFCGFIRKCIGVSVEIASITEVEIFLKFVNSISISISLKQEDYEGPEAAMFSSNHSSTWIW